MKFSDINPLVPIQNTLAIIKRHKKKKNSEQTKEEDSHMLEKSPESVRGTSSNPGNRMGEPEVHDSFLTNS